LARIARLGKGQGREVRWGMGAGKEFCNQTRNRNWQDLD